MATDDISTDVLVIGGGTAGMAAYRAARAAGATAVLVEAEHWGTTCARVGCMPSKLLIAAAEAAHAVEAAARFGIDAQGTVDGARVMERVRSERDRFVGFVERAVDGFPAEDRLFGRAVLEGPSVARVGERRVHARAIVLATGSRPSRLPLLEPLGDRVIVNDDVFNWRTLPRSVAVLGPGVIGLELGQALHRLGVRVHVYGIGGAVGPLTDPTLRAEAARLFGEELALHADARELAVRREGDEVVVSHRTDAGVVEERFEWLLATTGRIPNLDGLGLERLGVALDRRGVPTVDPHTLQVTDLPLFVAGDASNARPLLHEAADEGRIAGENAARFPAVRPGPRRSPLAIVFTDPNLAIVGESYAQLREREPVVGVVDYGDQGRSRVMGINRGRLHVYADPQNGRLLGAELVAPRGEHLAHLLAWAHQAELTIDELLQMPFYHPVVEEGVRTALRDAAAQLNQRQ